MQHYLTSSSSDVLLRTYATKVSVHLVDAQHDRDLRQFLRKNRLLQKLSNGGPLLSDRV